MTKTLYFKNLNGGEWFIDRLKEFLENKKFVKFINFKDNKIDILLSKEKKKNKYDKNKDNKNIKDNNEQNN